MMTFGRHFVEITTIAQLALRLDGRHSAWREPKQFRDTPIARELQIPLVRIQV
jgi:hypothetical protein